MNPGDISLFVDSVGEKHVGVVCKVNPDATVDVCVLKATQRGVKLSPTGEPRTFFDPNFVSDDLPMREPAADAIAATIRGSVLASVPLDVAAGEPAE